MHPVWALYRLTHRHGLVLAQAEDSRPHAVDWTVPCGVWADLAVTPKSHTSRLALVVPLITVVGDVAYFGF